MSNKDKDEMLAEYDFRGQKGVRGKYYKALKEGHKTIIHKTDGSIVVKETKLIALAPDVQEYFPDAESVNEALRGLIALVPAKRS
jgi:hypothetical protein